LINNRYVFEQYKNLEEVEWFGIAESTGSSKSKQIRDSFKIGI